MAVYEPVCSTRRAVILNRFKMATFLFVKIIHLLEHVSAVRIFVRVIILGHLEVSFADL